MLQFEQYRHYADSTRQNSAVKGMRATPRYAALIKSDLSQNLFFGFAGLVTAVSAWVIWGPSDIFPKQEPAGEPEHWTESQLRAYLSEVGIVQGRDHRMSKLI